jgi:hypothetical protein
MDYLVNPQDFNVFYDADRTKKDYKKTIDSTLKEFVGTYLPRNIANQFKKRTHFNPEQPLFYTKTPSNKKTNFTLSDIITQMYDDRKTSDENVRNIVNLINDYVIEPTIKKNKIDDKKDNTFYGVKSGKGSKMELSDLNAVNVFVTNHYLGPIGIATTTTLSKNLDTELPFIILSTYDADRQDENELYLSGRIKGHPNKAVCINKKDHLKYTLLHELGHVFGASKGDGLIEHDGMHCPKQECVMSTKTDQNQFSNSELASALYIKKKFYNEKPFCKDCQDRIITYSTDTYQNPVRQIDFG